MPDPQRGEVGVRAQDVAPDRAAACPERGDDRCACAARWINEAAKVERVLRETRNPLRVGGAPLVKGMHSTAAANLAAWLGVPGRVYSLCSSFCTGTDVIGHAYTDAA